MKASQKPGVVFQPQAGRRLQRGISTFVGAIRPTLGPLACGVAVDPMNTVDRLPEYLDSGGVIARRIIELENRDEDMGAMLVRSMLVRQQERVGDGTATTAVLFEAIYNAGIRYLAAGGNAMRLRHHLENLVPLVLAELEGMVVPLAGQAALTDVARTLCGDAELAALLGEAFDLVGAYGRLEIREDYGRGLRREYVEGTYYHGGIAARTLLAGDTNAVSLENPAIFLCDFEISDHKELFPVLQAAHHAGIQSLVIVARSLSEQAVALLIANNRLATFKATAVKLPGGNPTERMEVLDDLSHLTGARAVVKVAGETLDAVGARHFGAARRFQATKETFTLVGGGGDPVALRRHLARLRQLYHDSSDAAVRKWTLERLGILQGSSVTLWIGGFTEPEIKARKSLAQRAALTLRAAVQEGVVPGGGLALLNCRRAVQARLAASADTDEIAACRVLFEALAAPAHAIYRNAGYDAGDVMGRLLREPPAVGFDVVQGRVVDFCAAGILDSLLVLKTSVRNAITTAALALTVDSLVHLAQPEMVKKPE